MRSLLKFFALTYAVTWAFFAAGAALSAGTGSAPADLATLGGAIILVGVFGPSLVALALTARAGGRDAMRALLRGVVRWPAGARWYLFAVGYIAAIKLAAAVLLRLATGTWPPFGQQPVYVMLAAVAVSTPVQAGEEIGWRGYALPRLATRLGLGPASTVLGVIWACWHLPFFFMPGTDTYHQSFPVYLASVTAVSVAMAWLYWRTGGSLLVVMLLHAAANNTKDIVPSAAPAAVSAFTLSASAMAWLTTALLWLCAAYFLVRMRGATLQPGLQAEADVSEVAPPGSYQPT
jgi:membrane protease YdiL (CAAX protease family)